MCTACSRAPVSASSASAGNRASASTAAANGAIFASVSSRTVWRSSSCSSPSVYICGAPLHVAAVLAADLEECLGDLLQAAHPGGVHEHGEHVLTAARGLLERGERGVRLLAVPLLEAADPVQLRLLLFLGAAGERDKGVLLVGMRVAEGVDADDGQGAVVLAVLVQHRLVLDLAALVAGLHRAEHAAAGADRLELAQHRLLDQVGQLVDDERALQRVLVGRQAP